MEEENLLFAHMIGKEYGLNPYEVLEEWTAKEIYMTISVILEQVETKKREMKNQEMSIKNQGRRLKNGR